MNCSSIIIGRSIENTIPLFLPSKSPSSAGWHVQSVPYNKVMKQFLDHFILGFPVLFIKQYPYAWIAAVAFWAWPPYFSAVFLAVVVIGLLMLRWQSTAWMSNLRREHASPQGKFYVDEAPFSLPASARKILLLVLGGVVLAWLLKGQLGLSFWQFFIMIAGFTLFYQDTRFLGSPATYAITDQGIGIRFVPGHLDYRLFFPFREISRVQKAQSPKDKDWDVLARTQDAQAGLLMLPKDPNGFTRRIGKVFITPKNIDEFLAQLPPGCK